jgi:competence protein ComEA
LRVEPFLQFTDNHGFAQQASNSTKQVELDSKAGNNKVGIMDINKANFDDLLELQGIGRTFAARIIEHREKLGGFASLEQIKEIHGLPDSTYRVIVPHLKILTAVYRKISINKAILHLNHPYLSRKQSEIVIRYRLNHGDFKNMADLKNTGIFTDDILEKLQAYLIFD